MKRKIDIRAPMQEAAAVVHNGQTLALGGMTIYRRPFAFVTALLRREERPTGLTLLNFTSGPESDLLVGAGCVARTRTCYFGFEAFGLAPMFTQMASDGRLEVIEETEASIALGLRATMSAVGFMPSAAWIGTDLPKLRPDVKRVTDPYSGRELMAFPAIPCDVAVVHALVADKHGNARLNGNLAIDRELAIASEYLIVTAEEVVDQLSGPVDIAAPLAQMVVHAPRGAWPTSCHPKYPVGGGEIVRYSEACAAGRFDEYLDDLLSQQSG